MVDIVFAIMDRRGKIEKVEEEEERNMMLVGIAKAGFVIETHLRLSQKNGSLSLRLHKALVVENYTASGQVIEDAVVVTAVAVASLS